MSPITNKERCTRGSGRNVRDHPIMSARTTSVDTRHSNACGKEQKACVPPGNRSPDQEDTKICSILSEWRLGHGIQQSFSWRLNTAVENQHTLGSGVE